MDTMQANINTLIEKGKKIWKNFLEGVNKQGKDGKKITITFGVNKQSYYIALGILWATILLFGVGVVFVWNKHAQLTKDTRDLKELNQYMMKEFEQSEAMSDEKDNLPQTIGEILAMHKTLGGEKERLNGELNFKRSVYTEFLRNLLLPSLNIWKDPYTKELDLSILGKKYLDKNPYQDISLLSQWSSIIKDSGKDVGDNEVVNMKIGDLDELDNGFFRIPISIAFKSDSKRAFLLLVDKLSLTSNINNLGLLNDFTYYIFDAIREQKSDEIQQLMQEYKISLQSWQDEKILYNTVISHYLYTWIFAPDSELNSLIDDAIIDSAIKQSISCGRSESQEVCYFRFRNKYRTIPGLAYAVGLNGLVNKPLALKKFYAEIPPLIAIESFTFDKAKAQGFSLSNSNEYVGNINFSIYGRGIESADAEEISNRLTLSCFASGSSNRLDLSWALSEVQNAILQIEKIAKIWENRKVGEMLRGDNTLISRMGNLIELRDILSEDAKDYGTLSPYNKIIKNFEYYRMLKNVSLCSATEQENL